MSAPALDYEEMKSGFQSPRAARLADWEFRKEQRDFKKLVSRLAAKKWYHDHKGDEGYEERRQRNNALARAWTKANRALCNERQNLRRFKQWTARAGAGIRCDDCAVWFCEARPRKGKPRRFCSRACQNRYTTRMWQRRASLARGAKQRRKARP